MKKYIVEVDEEKTVWKNEQGQLHREDGPAIEWYDGSKSWWVNGQRHREDGPAIEWADGDKEWYLNGKLHREDGPAIENVDEYKAWFLNGEKLTKEQFNERMNPSVKEMTVADIEQLVGHPVKIVKG